MWERRRTQMAASATRALPLRAAGLRPLPRPLPCHSFDAGVPRCGGSQVLQLGEQPKLRGYAAAQVVVVNPPARGGVGAGSLGETAMQRAASATRAAAPTLATLRTFPPPTLCHGLEAGGGRAAAAHSCCSAVHSPSCDGKLPVRSLLPSNLREGRRSGRRGGERCPWGHQIRGGRQIRGVPRPCATPPPYATTPTRVPPSVPSRRRSLPTPASR